jgi:septal ring factor EnvC (AmiA/AmiB activator)
MADAKPYSDEQIEIISRVLMPMATIDYRRFLATIATDRKRIEELEHTKLGRVCPTCAKKTVNPMAWCDLLVLEENERLAVEIEDLESDLAADKEIMLDLDKTNRENYAENEKQAATIDMLKRGIENWQFDYEAEHKRVGQQAAEIERLKGEKKERDELLTEVMKMDLDIRVGKTIADFYERQCQALKRSE